MITGGGSWTTQVNAEYKQPLYVFAIPGKSIQLCSWFPLNLGGTTNAGACLPVLITPNGPNQTIDELNGQNSLAPWSVSANDPTGALKTLAAATDAIGQICKLYIGFPGLDVNNANEFVLVNTGRITGIDVAVDGPIIFRIAELLQNTANPVFLNGGPPIYTQFSSAAKLSLTSDWSGDTTRTVKITGFDGSGNALTETITLNGTTEVLSANTYTQIQSVTVSVAVTFATVTLKQGSGGTVIGYILKGQTSGTSAELPVLSLAAPKILDNGVPISDKNPRYIAGNPIDLILGIMQNELGVGQANPPVLVANTGGGSGTGLAGYAINPTWTFYNITSGGTLINPNTYLEVSDLIALRDDEFSGDYMEFKFTASTGGKAVIEKILKELGLVWRAKANGKLTLKTMKHPSSVSPVTITDRQIDGIPDTTRWPIINVINCTLVKNSDEDVVVPLPFANQTSLNTYKSPYVHTIDSTGLRLAQGGYQKLFLLANRIFNRHGFSTPIYNISTFWLNFVLEIGDFILLTHPKLVDLVSGTRGVTNVLCEVLERQPLYAEKKVILKVADTRFFRLSNGSFQIAAVGAAIPDYGSASAPQRAQYMFVSDNTGHYSTGANANQIQ